MSWLGPTLTLGKCHECGTVYRWEVRSGLKVRDAICRDCDAPLKKTRLVKEADVVDVEDAWLRKAQ